MSIFFSCPNGSKLNFNRKKITDIFWNFEFPTRFSSDFHFSHPSFCLWVAKFEDSWKPPLKGVCRGNYITTKPCLALLLPSSISYSKMVEGAWNFIFPQFTFENFYTFLRGIRGEISNYGNARNADFNYSRSSKEKMKKSLMVNKLFSSQFLWMTKNPFDLRLDFEKPVFKSVCRRFTFSASFFEIIGALKMDINWVFLQFWWWG